MPQNAEWIPVINSLDGLHIRKEDIRRVQILSDKILVHLVDGGLHRISETDAIKFGLPTIAMEQTIVAVQQTLNSLKNQLSEQQKPPMTREQLRRTVETITHHLSPEQREHIIRQMECEFTTWQEEERQRFDFVLLGPAGKFPEDLKESLRGFLDEHPRMKELGIQVTAVRQVPL